MQMQTVSGRVYCVRRGCRSPWGMSSHRLLALWAKANADSPTKYHPLAFHMLDVGAVAQQVFQSVLSDRMKDWLAESMGTSISGCEKWISFIAACHDIGKAHPRFQALVPALEVSLRNQGLQFSPLALAEMKVYHGTVTSKLMLGELRQMLDSGSTDPEFLELASFAAGSHHGMIPSSLEVMRLGPTVLGGTEWSELRRALMAGVMEAIGVDATTSPRLNSKRGNPLFVLLAGLISVSDWIGSSVDEFPYEDGIRCLDEYWCATSAKARHAVSRLMWGIGSQKGEPETLGQLFGFPKLYPLQNSAVALSTRLDGPSIVLIEGPMGQGKTEAAFFLENYWRRTLDDRGAYVALPTQATANQMFHRVKSYLERASFDGHVNLHLLHGYAALSPEYADLKTQTSISDEPPRVVAAQWFTSQKKRAILATYGVGTIDQALMAVLPAKHFFVRMFGLAGKTVVIDEVHAYDLFTSTLVDRMLAWLSELGCSVVVLSATLPRSRSAELVNAYAGEKALSHAKSYPRISWLSGSGAGSETIVSNGAEGRTLDISLDWILDDPEPIADLLIDKLQDGGHAALICNTVSRAQEMYQAIRGPLSKAQIKLDLFHARYPLEERLARENACISSFGKGERDASERHVVCATQVIEQSLDLDFDLIVTDIAPVDLLLQRAGRLHRHPDNPRPPALMRPTLYVIEPAQQAGYPGFGDSSFVYWESTLLSTYAHLIGKSHISIPRDVEDLVESVYPPSLPASTPPQWTARLDLLDRKREEALKSEGYMARSVAISSPHEGKIWKEISRYLEEDDEEVHVSLQARTRLTRPGVSLVCAYAVGSGVCADEEGALPITQSDIDSGSLLNALLNRTVRIDKPSVVSHFRRRQKTDLEVALDRTPLKGHRIIGFQRSLDKQDFAAVVDGHVIRLSQELGIVLGNVEEEE